eukprot:310698-Hanusia_phi.AAC.1
MPGSAHHSDLLSTQRQRRRALWATVEFVDVSHLLFSVSTASKCSGGIRHSPTCNLIKRIHSSLSMDTSGAWPSCGDTRLSSPCHRSLQLSDYWPHSASLDANTSESPHMA